MDIPQDVAAKERDLGMLDHEIWERFESQYRGGIELEAIRQTTFFNDNGAGEWKPIYRLPPDAHKGKPLSSKDVGRAQRAFFSGGHTDIFTPDPPSTLPL